MKQKLRWLATITPLVFLTDQMTKHWIMQHIPLGDAVPIVPGLFDLVHTRNRGAAFGFMSGLNQHVRLPFFFIVSLIVMALLVVYFFRQKDDRRGILISLAMILGGAIGNIWDRIFLGEVVDFLSFHWYDAAVHLKIGGWALKTRLEWPAFNVADASISVGVILLMILMARSTHT